MILEQSGVGEQQMVSKNEVGKVIDRWTKALTPTPGDEARQFLNKSNIFNEEKMDRLDPETDINFWLKYGVRYWEKLDDEVLGKAGMTLTRDKIKISSELAGEAALKLAEGEDVKNLSKAEQASMLVLTKAKLAAAEKMALEVYPALKSDFEAAKSAVDKNLTSLLVDVTKVRDVNNEIEWKRIIPVGKMAVPTLLTLGTMLISACATPAEAKPTGETPVGSTNTPQVTETASPTATEAVTPTEMAKEIVWPAQGTETTVQVEGLDFGMEFKDPEATYKMILEAMIANREYNGKYFQALLGTSSPTVEQFLTFLKSSEGPDGKPYYMPFSANGVEYKWLNGTGYVEVRYTPATSLREGVYLQDVVYIIFSPAEYQQYQESIDALLDYNAEGKIYPISFPRTYNPDNVSGLLMTPEGRLVFIQGDLRIIADNSPLNKDYNLGGEDGMLGGDDPKKVTAGLLVYTGAAKELSKDRQGEPGYCILPTCAPFTGAISYKTITSEQEVVKRK